MDGESGEEKDGFTYSFLGELVMCTVNIFTSILVLLLDFTTTSRTSCGAL